MKTIRLIFGDQLNGKHSWYNIQDENVVYVLFEMRQETDYVVHHIQKIVGFFAAMRSFAQELSAKGHRVIYYSLEHPNNTQTLEGNLNYIIHQERAECVQYQLPDEYRLSLQIEEIAAGSKIPFQSFDTEHFYTTREELALFFEGKKQFLMESFYRYMRKKHQLLMQGNQPEGGLWNYDKDNRKKWDGKVNVPLTASISHDVTHLIEMIKKTSIKTFGNINASNFDYPINRKEAIEQLRFFCENLLQHFGTYEDAMHTHIVFMFHSRLSFALNIKLISPKEVVTTVLRYYEQHKETISLNQVEGFVRQIIGWREYMRGMYWMLMPEYTSKNELNALSPLPNFMWTAKTNMNCLKHAVSNSLDNAYAHHIQRLMVIGNFMLLTNRHPDEVDQWYLGVYIDAIEWVQLPNTRGMSQYADGGLIATKPYISAAGYINKMSNYCEGCVYNSKTRTDEDSCPFNALYWNFLNLHREKLSNNHRMAIMYNQLNKMNKEELEKTIVRAQKIIDNPDDF